MARCTLCLVVVVVLEFFFGMLFRCWWLDLGDSGECLANLLLKFFFLVAGGGLGFLVCGDGYGF
jgi:hypothetical protein